MRSPLSHFLFLSRWMFYSALVRPKGREREQRERGRGTESPPSLSLSPIPTKIPLGSCERAFSSHKKGTEGKNFSPFSIFYEEKNDTKEPREVLPFNFRPLLLVGRVRQVMKILRGRISLDNSLSKLCYSETQRKERQRPLCYEVQGSPCLPLYKKRGREPDLLHEHVRSPPVASLFNTNFTPGPLLLCGSLSVPPSTREETTWSNRSFPGESTPSDTWQEWRGGPGYALAFFT